MACDEDEYEECTESELAVHFRSICKRSLAAEAHSTQAASWFKFRRSTEWAGGSA